MSSLTNASGSDPDKQWFSVEKNLYFILLRYIMKVLLSFRNHLDNLL